MPTVEWSDSFLIGVPQIDKHNKRLVELMRKTQEALRGHPSPHEINTVLDELINYIFYHLASEEIWMSRMKFPSLNGHIEEHLRYTRFLLDMHKTFKAGIITAVEMMSCVFNMFVNHIIRTDRIYARFVTSKS